MLHSLVPFLAPDRGQVSVLAYGTRLRTRYVSIDAGRQHSLAQTRQTSADVRGQGSADHSQHLHHHLLPHFTFAVARNDRIHEA